MKTLLLTILTVVVTTLGYTQALSYVDPAQAYNRLVLEQGGNTYEQLGNYKVKGIKYLYGGNLTTNIYAGGTTLEGVTSSFDTYTQNLEENASGMTKRIIVNGVDSFEMILKDKSKVQFIAAKYVDAAKKGYFQLVHRGNTVCLYKYYESVLAIPSDNYVNGQLREYNLQTTYYFKEHTQASFTLLPNNFRGIAKAVKSKVDITTITSKEEYNQNIEQSLLTIFMAYP